MIPLSATLPCHLCHAFYSQFSTCTLHLLPDDQESLLREVLAKPLSVIYKALLLSVYVGLDPLKSKWQASVPELDGEDREDAINRSCSWLPGGIGLSSSKYYIWSISCSSLLPNGHAKIVGVVQELNFFYVFWPCFHVPEFWSVVTHFIHSLTTISIPQRVTVGLLGLVNPLAFTTATRTLLGLLLFYARKAIVLNWKSDRPPSFQCWKSLLNSVFPLYRMTCLSRGCPKKFHKVWDIWLKLPSTTVARSGPAGGGTSWLLLIISRLCNAVSMILTLRFLLAVSLLFICWFCYCNWFVMSFYPYTLT